MKRVTLIEGLIIVVVFVMLLSGLFRGWLVDPGVAVRALETQGYSNVRIADHSWFAVGLRGCDKNDAAKFTATATNPAGRRVELFVCTGWLFKGATVRTE